MEKQKPEKTEVKQLNVYQKLQKVRAQLVALNLKKTGKNTYSNYTYYELGDFLPALNKLMDDFGITTKFNIYPKKSEKQTERAVLLVIDSEKPEDRVEFISETSEVEVGKKKDGTGGAGAIQNLGAKITYMRRYLLMNAFEIVESDWVDQQKQNEPHEIDIDDIDRVMRAKDFEDLAIICKEIKTKVEPKYHRSLLQYYSARKAELEGVKDANT